MSQKILVVEDEEHIRGLIVQTIEAAFEDLVIDEELEVIEASNGEEGLIMAKQECPNLMFLDVMMPKVNGFDVCKEIKENPEYSNKPYIVMLTAKGQEVDKAKGETVGCDEYMTKPFDPEKIILKVEKEFGIKRGNYYK